MVEVFTTAYKHSGDDSWTPCDRSTERFSSVARVDSDKAVAFQNKYPTVEVPFQSLSLTKAGGAGISGQFDFVVKVNDTLYAGDAFLNGRRTTIARGAATLSVGDTLVIEDLPVGSTYEITETGLGSDFDSPVYTVTGGTYSAEGTTVTGTIGLLSGGGAHIITCTNRLAAPNNSIRIYKTDMNGNPLPDAEFNISSIQNKAVTGADGYTDYYEIPANKFPLNITETNAPEGYRAGGAFKVMGTFDANGRLTHIEVSGTSGYFTKPGYLEVDNDTMTIKVKNEEDISGSITVTKKIDKFYAPHGNAAFYFTLRGDDGRTYTKYVEFTEANSNGLSVQFDNLPMGQYVLSESQALRYDFNRIDSVSQNGSISGETVVFTLTKDASVGSATFHNKKIYEKYFSDEVTTNNSFVIVTNG